MHREMLVDQDRSGRQLLRGQILEQRANDLAFAKGWSLVLRSMPVRAEQISVAAAIRGKSDDAVGP